jgi:hypothetical protein
MGVGSMLLIGHVDVAVIRLLCNSRFAHAVNNPLRKGAYLLPGEFARPIDHSLHPPYYSNLQIALSNNATCKDPVACQVLFVDVRSTHRLGSEASSQYFDLANTAPTTSAADRYVAHSGPRQRLEQGLSARTVEHFACI